LSASASINRRGSSPEADVLPWKLEPARDLGLPFSERLRSHCREPGLVETAVHLLWWGLVRGYLAAGHRLTVVGREHIPKKPPFVLVANHTSHLDALALAAPLPWRLRDRIFPIAAGDTFFQTSARAVFAAGLLNALPMWRMKCGPQALKALRQRLLEDPCIYILFPEGTRSRDGALRRFKPGLGMLVAGTDVPIVPCCLQGTYQSLPPNRSWPRFKRITLRVGQPLLFPEASNERSGWETIAAETEAAVRGLCGEMCI
jgi:1-acyl-sn-glycerol-3-phosphate acyltransferase